MAIRVSEPEVREVADVESTVSVSTFIKTASLMVDEELVGKGLSTDRLRQIELYLAAHFAHLSIHGPETLYQRIGEAAERFTDEYEPGLSSTRFGQQAVVLDTSGALRRLANNKLPAQFRVV